MKLDHVCCTLSVKEWLFSICVLYFHHTLQTMCSCWATDLSSTSPDSQEYINKSLGDMVVLISKMQPMPTQLLARLYGDPGSVGP